MSKPDDIPQDVWDSAFAIAEANEPSTATLARAIMAAKAEEREACALVVLDYPPEGFNAELYERTERFDEHDPFWKFEGDSGNWAALMGEVLKPYAAAIRKRGEG